MRTRNVCFTYHFPDDNTPLLDPSTWDKCTYCIYQLELTPTNNSLHYQGYIEFSAPRTLKQLRELDGIEGAHFEQRHGTAQEAKAYCEKNDETKIDGPWEWGQISQQGKRTDLEAVFSMARRHATQREIAEAQPATFIRYNRGINAVRTLYAQQRDWPMELHFYIGPSGCGKTRAAHELYPGAYWKTAGKWWDGYDGQEVVVLDEYYGHWMSFSDLLKLTDRYPLNVETKGGMVAFVSKKLIFTSNQPIEQWYNAEKTHQGPWETNPLNRRVKEFGTVHNMGVVHPPMEYHAPQDDDPFSIRQRDQEDPFGNENLEFLSDLEGLL